MMEPTAPKPPRRASIPAERGMAEKIEDVSARMASRGNRETRTFFLISDFLFQVFRRTLSSEEERRSTVHAGLSLEYDRVDLGELEDSDAAADDLEEGWRWTSHCVS